MKAVLCHAFGLPDTLTVAEVASPHPAPGEVKIAVRACGVNFPDVLLVQGLYQMKPPFPFSPGLEVAGDVLAVGADVTHFKPGDRVIGIVNYGGMAQEVVVPQSMTLPLPEAMPYEHGAAFPIAYGTSHVALEYRARLQPGETLLVLGAAGGVGLTAVEIGKRLGATVIAAASTPAKLALAQQYGADHVIQYGVEDLRERVQAITGGAFADVIYDPVGGDLFDQALRCIAWEGRYLVIGFAAGRIPELPVNRVLLKNSALLGTFWGAYAQHRPQVMAESLQTLLSWYAAGRLKPHLHATFPLERAADALKALLHRQAMGKVVILP
ncbi:MAG: NADPH:quinone oxidoreductase family protein [Anaerolineae bacterium]|nr:NADPH:quinone oxidoreductase family protein [Anaerolineae bacterium]